MAWLFNLQTQKEIDLGNITYIAEPFQGYPYYDVKTSYGYYLRLSYGEIKQLHLDKGENGQRESP
jgi:hypothetical protein